jgi:hypothetical protein
MQRVRRVRAILDFLAAESRLVRETLATGIAQRA